MSSHTGSLPRMTHRWYGTQESTLANLRFNLDEDRRDRPISGPYYERILEGMLPASALTQKPMASKEEDES